MKDPKKLLFGFIGGVIGGVVAWNISLTVASYTLGFLFDFLENWFSVAYKFNLFTILGITTYTVGIIIFILGIVIGILLCKKLFPRTLQK